MIWWVRWHASHKPTEDSNFKDGDMTLSAMRWVGNDHSIAHAVPEVLSNLVLQWQCWRWLQLQGWLAFKCLSAGSLILDRRTWHCGKNISMSRKKVDWYISDTPHNHASV